MALRDFDLGAERDLAARAAVRLVCRSAVPRHGGGACGGRGVEGPHTLSFAPPPSVCKIHSKAADGSGYVYHSRGGGRGFAMDEGGKMDKRN